jgi:alanine transaminase
MYNGKAVPYYLNEEGGWSLNSDQVLESIKKARDSGIDVRAMCIINPGK